MTLVSSHPQSYPTAEAKEDRRSGSLLQEVRLEGLGGPQAH